MAHFNFVISQNAKWGHAGFYIDCHRMTVPENILLQKSTAQLISDPPKSLGPLLSAYNIFSPRQTCSHRQQTLQAPVSIKPMVFCHPPRISVHPSPR